MKLKKSLLKKSLAWRVKNPVKRISSCGIYLIIDRPTLDGCSLKKIFSVLNDGKIGIVQWRDNQSLKPESLDFIFKLSQGLNRKKTLLIVNNDPWLALAANADGVHLGQNDLPLKLARKILGQDKIIGISCHNLTQAKKAQQQGADYLGVGPVFSTPIKPEDKPIGVKLLKKIKQQVHLPCFAIGGIHLGNLKKITGTGVRQVAVCRAIIQAKDAQVAVRQFDKILNQ